MKEIVKMIARAICRVCVLPLYVLFCIEKRLLSAEKCFKGYSQFFSLLPGFGGEYLRREFYRLALRRCSKDCCISFGSVFTSPNASIGKGVYIGMYCVLGDVDIGDFTLIGSCVEIINGAKQHHIEDVNIPIIEQGGEFPKVYIGEDCWIGEGVMVMNNIGKKSVIGARSLVTKEIEKYSIATGSPARVVRKRKPEDIGR